MTETKPQMTSDEAVIRWAEDPAAYWKGAYDRMASRNIEVSAELDRLRNSHTALVEALRPLQDITPAIAQAIIAGMSLRVSRAWGSKQICEEAREDLEIVTRFANALPVIRAALAGEKDAPTDDGWIEWKGGERPVPGETPVTVRFANGEEVSAPGEDWAWSREGGSFDIVAYRVKP